MNPTNTKHAVFQTSRHGEGSAMVQIVGTFGTFGLVVPAEGKSAHMSEAQKVEALRAALKGMGEAAELLERHLAHIDPGGSAPAKPEKRIPLAARVA
jgi:hypothetical protein